MNRRDKFFFVLCIVILFVFLTGCGDEQDGVKVTDDDIEDAERACWDNGGIDKFYYYKGKKDDLYCNDGWRYDKKGW